MSSDEVCGFEKEDGDTCGVSFGLCDCHGECFSHSPCREEDRREARSRGGVATARGAGIRTDELPPLTSASAAEHWCDVVGRAAVTDRLSAEAANAALRAVKEWRQARETGEVTDRLEALQDALAQWRKTGDPEPVLELVDGGEA